MRFSVFSAFISVFSVVNAVPASSHAPASVPAPPDNPPMTRHSHDLTPWQHDHRFDGGNPHGEARTRWVLALTVATMGAEIAAGWWTGSMALLADGWHMGTHALALGVAALAYALARRHASDRRFAFGTWKIEVLGGFASALVLAMVAIGIAFESLWRLWRAEPLDAGPALLIAGIGLAVNLVSAWLLHGGEGHGHDHGHDHDHHDHDHPAHDLNLRAAYLHVLADALTSVLAIAALAGAWWFGWGWLDPLVGVLGAVVIVVWARGLLRETSAVLLDREMDHPLAGRIRTDLESDGDAKVADLHVWRVGRDQFAAIAVLVADVPLAPSAYRERLRHHRQLAHVSVEVNRCPGPAAA